MRKGGKNRNDNLYSVGVVPYCNRFYRMGVDNKWLNKHC